MFANAKISFCQNIPICLTLFHTEGGGGGADSALLQIVFFITSVRDAAEPQNFGDFSQNLMDNKILNMEMTNFQPESSAMAIFGKSPCQKVVKLHLYCHNF